MTTLNGQFCAIDGKMCFDGDCGHCETYKEAQRKPHSYRGHLEKDHKRTLHEADEKTLEDLKKRNITPVIVPDGDEDHRM